MAGGWHSISEQTPAWLVPILAQIQENSAAQVAAIQERNSVVVTVMQERNNALIAAILLPAQLPQPVVTVRVDNTIPMPTRELDASKAKLVKHTERKHDLSELSNHASNDDFSQLDDPFGSMNPLSIAESRRPTGSKSLPDPEVAIQRLENKAAISQHSWVTISPSSMVLHEGPPKVPILESHLSPAIPGLPA
jgi:hypothetical protein